MNDEQIKWLAEKLGWKEFSSFEYASYELIHGTSYSIRPRMAHKTTNFGWVLIRAGAWDVVTKMGVQDKVEFWHSERMGWYCHLGGECKAGISNADPIQAVTEAVIAMWESEQ